MRFAQPGWLFLLALPLALFLYALFDERLRAARFARFAAEALWPRLAPGWNRGAARRKALLLSASLAFAVLAAARPQWGSHPETVNVTGMDIMVALDVSNSMEVEDAAPSRLMKARHLVKTLLEQLTSDRVGIVAFADSAFVASPLTSDLGYVRDTVDILGPKSVLNQGSDLGAAIETARKSLDRGAEEGPGMAGPQASKVIVLISDGEDHSGKAVAAARELREAGVRLFAIGVGTEKGGPIPVRDPSGNLVGYKRDRKGEPVVSRFHPKDLVEIARAGGGSYWNATLDEKEVLDLVLELGSLSRGDYAEKQYLVHEERFQYPLAVAVLLLLLELGVPLSRVAALLVIGLGGLLAPAAAHAASPLEVYRYNQKGVDAYKEGKLEQAKKDFGSAQALDPERPELDFNRGVVQMGEGDVEGAEQSFRASAREAFKRKDPALMGKSLYNLGGALSQKSDFPGAAKAYLGALSSARKAGDQGLERDIRKNLELLEQQKQQQQQQKQQGEQGKPDDQQKGEEQEKQDKQGEQGEQKDPKSGDQPEDKKDPGKDKDEKNKQNPGKYEGVNQKQKFQSKDLGEEDAERVLAELTSKERELREKLKKQSGNPTPNEKDW